MTGDGQFWPQGWQRPGQGKPFAQDGYFPGQGWQRGSGMAGSPAGHGRARGQGPQDGGGQVSAGGISVPAPGATTGDHRQDWDQDWDQDPSPGAGRPILRVTWPGSTASPGSASRAGGAPGPPMTFRQRVAAKVRCWWWDRWDAFEDNLIAWIDHLRSTRS